MSRSPMNRSPITTHVLDTSLGRPAAGVAVTVNRVSAAGCETVGGGTTDDNGRVMTGLIDAADFVAGHYRIEFAVADYCRRHDQAVFFPVVAIDFIVTAGEDHYHVPLLLSPYGYSTYRGS